MVAVSGHAEDGLDAGMPCAAAMPVVIFGLWGPAGSRPESPALDGDRAQVPEQQRQDGEQPAGGLVVSCWGGHRREMSALPLLSPFHAAVT